MKTKLIITLDQDEIRDALNKLIRDKQKYYPDFPKYHQTLTARFKLGADVIDNPAECTLEWGEEPEPVMATEAK